MRHLFAKVQPIAAHRRIEPGPERFIIVIEQGDLSPRHPDLEAVPAVACHDPRILASKRAAQHIAQVVDEPLLLGPDPSHRGD
ncbi:MAG TPA: hypothetical protein VFH67_08215 [bacterium]|nr:hypothetical protein [bacterium]